MTTGVGRFVLLSLGLHLLLLAAWHNHEDRLYQAGQSFQITLLPAPTVTTTASTIETTRTGTPATVHDNHPDVAIAQVTASPAAITIPNTATLASTPQQSGRMSERLHDPGADVADNPSDNDKSPLSRDDMTVASLQAQLQAIMASYFSYPTLAQRRNWQGEVRLGLRVEANGQLSNIHIIKSSGYSILDRAAIKSLRQIAALPDADNWLHGRYFDTVMPVEYRLVDS